MDASELRQLLSERGVVEVVAYYPDDSGNQTNQSNQTVLTGDDIADVDPPTQRGDSGIRGPGAGPRQRCRRVPAATERPRIHQRGVGRCSLSGTGDGVSFDHDQPQYCLLTVVDGEVLDAHSMGDGSTSQGPGLATSMQNGDWADNPTFQMSAPSPATGPVALGQPPSRQPARPAGLRKRSDLLDRAGPRHPVQGVLGTDRAPLGDHRQRRRLRTIHGHAGRASDDRDAVAEVVILLDSPR